MPPDEFLLKPRKPPYIPLKLNESKLFQKFYFNFIGNLAKKKRKSILNSCKVLDWEIDNKSIIQFNQA